MDTLVGVSLVVAKLTHFSTNKLYTVAVDESVVVVEVFGIVIVHESIVCQHHSYSMCQQKEEGKAKKMAERKR